MAYKPNIEKDINLKEFTPNRQASIDMLPEIVRMTDPVNSSVGVVTDPLLKWASYPKTSNQRFRVQIGTGKTLEDGREIVTDIVHSAIVNAFEYQVPDQILSSSTTYFWQVTRGNLVGIDGQVTGISISSGTNLIEGQSRDFNVTVSGLGSFDDAYTASITSGAGHGSISQDGDTVTLTANADTAGNSITWEARSDADNDIVATRTLNIVEEVQTEDSIQGDFNTLVKLYEDTHDPEGVMGAGYEWRNEWDLDNTTPETMDSLFGIETWKSDDPEVIANPAMEGRVRSIKLNGTEGWVSGWEYKVGVNGIKMSVQGNNPPYNVNPPDDHITELGGNKLVGTIEDVPFANLKYCQYLNLMQNHLTGSVPWEQIGRMNGAPWIVVYLNGGNGDNASDPPLNSPNTQYNISKFQSSNSVLLTRSNMFTGLMTAGIGQLTNCHSLILASRGGEAEWGIEGAVPDEFRNLTEMRMFVLGFNNIDYLPQLDTMTNLQMFNISRQTTQPTSSGTNDQPALENFNDPSDGNYTGGLSWTEGLTDLRWFHIDNNWLRGPIIQVPNSPIQNYSLNGNDHEDTFQDWWVDGTVPTLRFIGVSGNRLTGELTPVTNDQYRRFTAGECDFHGHIDVSYLVPKNPGTQFRRNRFTTFPWDLRHMFRLKQWRIQENDMEGRWAVFDFAEDFEFYFDLDHVRWVLSDSGDATSGGANTLTDTSKSWTENEHAGKWVRYKPDMHDNRGPQRKIISNTSDTLTLRSEYDVETSWPSVSTGDSYEIAEVINENLFEGSNSLEQMEVEDNRFVFRDWLLEYEGKTLLEWYVEKATRSWGGHDQKEFGPKPFDEDTIIDVTPGSNFEYSLSDYVSHENNEYQWQKQSGGSWNNVSGQTSNVLTINDFSGSDTGSYRLRVTNTLHESLTNISGIDSQELFSKPIQLIEE